MSLRLKPHDGRSWIVVGIAFVFALLFSIAGLRTRHALLGLVGGNCSNLIDGCPFDVVFAAAALLMLLRALLPSREIAWLLFGLGTIGWVCAHTLLGVTTDRFALAEDLLFLSGYLFAGGALVLLVRLRIAGIDLARWLDGFARTVIAATSFVARRVCRDVRHRLEGDRYLRAVLDRGGKLMEGRSPYSRPRVGNVPAVRL